MNGLDKTKVETGSLSFNDWFLHCACASVYADTNGSIKNGIDLVMRVMYRSGDDIDGEYIAVPLYESFYIICHPKLAKHFEAFTMGEEPPSIIVEDNRMPYRSFQWLYSMKGMDKDKKCSVVAICPQTVIPFSECEFDPRLFTFVVNIEDWKW